MLKSHDITSKSKRILLAVGMGIFGILILIYDYRITQKEFNGLIPRNEVGRGDKFEEIMVQAGDVEESLNITISEQKLSEEETEKIFHSAIEEIEETFLGRNQSLDQVKYSPIVKDTYADGLVGAQWHFSNYDVISPLGELKEEGIPQEGTIVETSVNLSYKEVEYTYSFNFIAKPLDENTREGLIYAIEAAVKENDENSTESQYLKLPEKTKEKKLYWRKKMNFRGIGVIVIGLIASVGLYYGERKDEEQELKRQIKEKQRDYPQIVSTLAILMGAGMSFRQSLEKMCSRYLSEKEAGICETRLGYEELILAYRDINKGTSELGAIEAMGARSGCKEFRKLAMLLGQNVKKGSRELIYMLEKEDISAFEMRKQMALRAGEEASTKLLMPMGGMLMIVIIVLVVPALLSMNI